MPYSPYSYSGFNALINRVASIAVRSLLKLYPEANDRKMADKVYFMLYSFMPHEPRNEVLEKLLRDVDGCYDLGVPIDHWLPKCTETLIKHSNSPAKPQQPTRTEKKYTYSADSAYSFVYWEKYDGATLISRIFKTGQGIKEVDHVPKHILNPQEEDLLANPSEDKLYRYVIRVRAARKVQAVLDEAQEKNIDVASLLELNTVNKYSGSARIPEHLEPIDWRGSQKELAEYLLEAKQKGWLGNLPIKTIKRVFTRSATIDQYLQPTITDGVAVYAKLYTKRYHRRFESIMRNHSKEGPL